MSTNTHTHTHSTHTHTRWQRHTWTAGHTRVKLCTCVDRCRYWHVVWLLGVVDHEMGDEIVDVLTETIIC